MNLNTGRKRLRSLSPVILLVIGIAASFLLSSCTPESDLPTPESDVVITLYNQQVDFGAITTFAMPDTIIHLVAEGDSDQLSRKYDQAILSLIATNLEARGYVRIDEGSPDVPDVLVLAGASALEFWYWYSYYPGDDWSWYPGWGWWGGYPGWDWSYPPPSYGPAYAYTLGTLFVTMVDPNKPDAGNTMITTCWLGVCNGLLNPAGPSKLARLSDSINQLFTQSPYLRSSGL